ncbi:MAG: hypothetical protein HY614_05040, partial [Candidatus Rokubacteria bacterium]|nr:hypothetical protein [Candidatus Rokubacteria bacterium]
MRSTGSLLRRLSEADGVTRCARALREAKPASLAGLSGASRALALLLLRAAVGRPLAVVGADDREAARLRRDLEALAPVLGPECECLVLPFPPREADPRAGIETHPRTAAERVAALRAARSGAPAILLAPLASLAQPLPPAERFDAAFSTLRAGEEAAPEALMARLEAAGYARLETV